jgi:hypothetical protein
MEQKRKNRTLTGNEKGAVASYSVIAAWSLILSISTGFPFRNLRVISFINFFAMALICLLPLYLLRVKTSYLVGSIIGVVYMVGGFIVNPPAPWVSDPSIGNLLMWTAVYAVGVLGVFFSSQAYYDA